MSGSETIPGVHSWLLDPSSLSLTSRQTELHSSLVKWLARVEHPAARYICGLEKKPPTDRDVIDLERAFLRKFRPFAEAVEAFKVLRKIVHLGREIGSLDMAPTRVPTLVRRPQNPLSRNSAEAIRSCREWRSALHRQLLDGRLKAPGSLSTDAGARFLTGQLLASAVLHSGLLETTLLVALAKTLLSAPDKFRIYDGRIVLDLSLPWRGLDDMEHRCWWPQPDTAMLLVSFKREIALQALDGLDPETPAKVANQIVWKSLATYFNHWNISRSTAPRSLSSFLQTAAADAYRELPALTVAYATRRIVSHSLKPHVLGRLSRSPDKAEMRQPEPRAITPPTNVGQDAERLDDPEPDWLPQLRQALKAQNHAVQLRQVEAYLAESGHRPSATLLGRFAKHLGSAPVAYAARPSPASIRNHVLCVARRLTAITDCGNLADLSTETLEVIYAEAMDIASDGGKNRRQRRSVCHSLREFHRFMVAAHSKEPVNEREVFGIADGLVPVDANLISLDEYQRVLHHLDTRSPQRISRDIIRIARLITMLGFRCGLRRMEALMLQIGDVKLARPEALLVRPTEARRLKTKNSARTLPLDALLEPGEREELRAWIGARQRIGAAGPDQLLFAEPRAFDGAIPQDTIFPLIHNALRETTGDASLRFHHLRHSFATWTFLRLMLSDLKSVAPLFPAQPLTEAWLFNNADFRATLYRNTYMTRRHAYAVAALLGHSGPDISLEHYVHAADTVLYLALQRNRDPGMKQRVLAACGESRSGAYRLAKECTVEALPANVLEGIRKTTEKSRPKKRGRRPGEKAPLPDSPLLIHELEESLFYRACRLICDHDLMKTPLEDLGQRYGFGVEYSEKIWNRAIEISGMTTGRRGAFRHRMMEIRTDKRDPNSTHRVPCPNFPRLEAEKAIVQRLAPRLEYLASIDPGLVQDAIGYFIRNAWQTRNDLVFRDPSKPETALRYVQFLGALGFKQEEILYVSFDKTARSRPLARWKTALNLNWRHRIDKTLPPNTGSESARLWLGIRPQFEDEQAANGFRFIMVVSAIALL